MSTLNAVRKKYLVSGFTLIEILIALFVFSFLALIMTNALHSVMTTQSRIEKQATRLAEIQLALLFLSRDIEQAIDRSVMLSSGAVETAFIGTPVSMKLTHAGFVNPLGQLHRSTLQRTHYFLQNHHLQRETWDALDQTVATAKHDRSLLKEVDDFQIQYLDQKGQLQNRWPPATSLQTNANKTALLPRAVRIELILHDAGKLTQVYIIPGQKVEKQN